MKLIMTMAWLALRELWISPRLLVLLVPFISAGALAALLPMSVSDATDRFAAALGVATMIVAAVAATSLATERRLGRAGWLVSQAVPRGSLLAGWLVAICAATLPALAAAGLVAWLALSESPRAPAAGSFALDLVAVGCGTLAAAALGLLAGTTLSSVAAPVVALLICCGVAAVTIAAPAIGSLLPGAGHQALAGLPDTPRPLGGALQAAGVSLGAAAILLAVARAAFERADL
ncbi:MAG: hypothetical protein ACRDGV_07820 [Candidatus Limnocylindria bacterium]